MALKTTVCDKCCVVCACTFEGPQMASTFGGDGNECTASLIKLDQLPAVLLRESHSVVMNQ